MDAVKIEEVDDASWEGQAMRKICSDNRGHLSVSPCKLGKCRVIDEMQGGGKYKQAKCRQISIVWMGLSLLREQGGFGS
jgi:hypothetical protein